MPDDLKEANRKKGMQGENYFASILNSKGIDFKYINDWYDYDVRNNKKSYKVEVKSCELIVKNKTRKRYDYRQGQFIFKLRDSYEKIVKENIWICFVVRHQDQFMLIGFCKAEDLKGMRSIAIHNLSKCKIINLDAWLKEILR